MHGRPSCIECDERQKRDRGCGKPGQPYAGQAAYRSTSPAFKTEEERVVRECPIGLALRETPQIFDALRAFGHLDNAGMTEVLSAPPWLQSALGILGYEHGRLSEMARKRRQTDSDARYGQSVLRGL